MVGFSSGTIRARNKCSTFFEMLKEKNLSTQNPISSKSKIQEEGDVKTFSDEGKLREFVASMPTLRELLKEVI